MKKEEPKFDSDRSFPKVFAIGVALLGATFAADAGQGPMPTICNRACWGARASAAAAQMGALDRAIIHHTAGASDYTTDYNTAKAKVRSVQNIHMDGNGWSDIGYHFVVSPGGHIFEGRVNSIPSWPRGAHDGNNGNSFGFNILGNYADGSEGGPNQIPTAASLNSLYDIIAWKMPSAWSPYGSGSYNGNTVGRLDGHRKVKATACPGNNIHNAHITSNYNGGNARNGVNARKNGVVTPPPPAERVDTFVRGPGDNLYMRSYDNGTWYDWANLGGGLTSDPSGVSWGLNRLDIFARGANNNLFLKSYDNGTWFAWANLGENLAGAPDAASWGPGNINVFWRGTDNALWYKQFSGGVWNPATSLGGTLTSDPTAVSWGVNRVDVFFRGPTGTCDTVSWTGTQWVWWSLGGGITDAPDVCSWGSGRLDVFARGSDNALWIRSYENGWFAWASLGGSFTSGPGATSRRTGILDAFIRNPDGTMAQADWNGSSWIWSNKGGGLIGGPDACSWTNP